MARTYKRDARGRFAGGGGGGGGRKGRSLPAPTKRTATGKTKRQGLLTQRAAVSAAQAKLKSKDPADRSLTGQLSLRAQKAAVTRAKNKLAAAQKSGRIRLSGRDGVIRPRKGGARPAAVAMKPATSRGLPSTAIRDRSVPRSRRPGMRTRDLSDFSTTVYGIPTRGGRFGTRSVGADGRVTSRQAVAPRRQPGRRVYTSANGNERSRTAVQRMRDGNYAVTTTRINANATGGYSKTVRTDVKKPQEMRRVLRSAVQGALLGGSKRVGTRRVGRRVM